MTTLVAHVALLLYRVYFATLRVRAVLADGRIIRAQDYPLQGQILALCERDTVALCGLILRQRAAVLVSHGRDGDWASKLLSVGGCVVVRGSARRGGAAALLQLLRSSKRSDLPVAVVVDGPLGPAGVAKPGAIACGLKSGRPVRPIGVATRWKLTLPGTWSGIYVPLPFSTVVVTAEFEDALPDGQPIAALTDRLTRQLATAHQRASAHLAQRRLLPAVSAFGVRVRRATVLLRDALLAALALPFLVAVWALPWRAAAALGRWYGYVAWAVMPGARRVGMINLRRAIGCTLSPIDARRAVRDVFAHLGQSIVEGIQFSRRFNREPQAARILYELEDPELEQQVLRDPRPRIFVTGHLGSWELAAAIAASQTGRRGAVIVRPVDNWFLNALWRFIRVSSGGEWIDKRGAAAEALARLRRGEDVAMLLDEHGGPRGVFVPFFGTLASTRKTPAVLSLVTGAPVVVGACIRRKHRPFLFRLACLEPNRQLTPDESIRDLTARIVSTYEAWIRDDPMQWRWIHWRWKARPDGTEEKYGRDELRRAFHGVPESTLVIR